MDKLLELIYKYRCRHIIVGGRTEKSWRRKLTAFVQTEKICPNGPKGSVEPQFLHEKQIGSFLNVSLGLLRKWRANGEGPVWVKFGNSVRYPVSGLEEYISKSKREFTGQTKPPMKRGPSQ